MKPGIFRRDSTKTSQIQLDTGKCNACWKCLKTCPQNAFSRIDKTRHDTKKQKKKNLNKFSINLVLLLSGIIMVLSGLILQLGYHMDEHHEGVHRVSSQPIQYELSRGIDTGKIILGLNYHDWSVTHKFAIVFVTLLMIYHIYTHWKWYKVIINKHLIRKNFQSITLSVLFLVIAVTGLVPWLVDLSGSTNILRLNFIEIHDKLALILIVFLFLHIYKRRKWLLSV